MNAAATLTPHKTVRVQLTDWADVELIKRIPGRNYLSHGFTANPAWEIPATAEAVQQLRRSLPLVEVAPAIDDHLQARVAWEAAVDRAKQGDHDHEWPTDALSLKPYQHQRRGHAVASTLIKGAPGAGLWYDMGLGKTATALAVLASIKPTVALVVCPASVIGVWEKEVREHATFPVRAWPLLGPVAKRAAKVMSLPIDPFDGTTLLITNYEVLWRDHLLKALCATDIEVMIADEAHRLKSAGSQQSKAARKIGSKSIRIPLTGTPTDTPIDWYGIYRWLDPTVFGTSFTAFKARYFHEVPMPHGGSMVTGIRAEMEPELLAKANSLAHACSKDDALDLPERIDIDRTCELEPKAQKIYSAMRREAIAFLDSGDTVVGQNVLTRMMRLSQITGGFLKDEDGGAVQVSTAKLDLLRDTLIDVLSEQEKVVVFARFTAEIDAIRKMLRSAALGWIEAGVIDGRVPIGPERDEVIRVFQEEDDPRVLVVQTRAGGAGITLHRASCAVFYSLGHSLIEWQQARDRIHRIGQTRKCTYVNLVADGTLDAKVLAALRGKHDVSHHSLHRWREVLS